MLTEKERSEIEAEAGKYEFRRAACIDALKIVQSHRGWVDDGSIKGVAELLGLSPDEVDGVATFYSLIFRRPVGRHVMLVCNTISCMVTGFEQNLEHIKKRLNVDLGGTTADNMFTVLPVPCLGACDRAPAMMVDGELYTDLTPERIDGILESYGWGR